MEEDIREMENPEITDVQDYETAVQPYEACDEQPEEQQLECAAVEESPEEIRARELKEAKKQALIDVKNEKYKAKLIVRQAKLRARIADLNSTIFDLEKELDGIAKELTELNE